jgi:hypothetical protein
VTGDRSQDGGRGSRARPKGRGATAAGLALLAAATLGLCLPLLGGINFTPDTAEYTGIARRLAEGQGLTTAIKWHFLDHGPVVRPAAVERPILYPLFGALVLKLAPAADPFRALQTANALLAALNVVVAVGAFRTVVPPAAAWLGAACLALSPGFTQTATVALSDQLFLLLWLLALWLLPNARGARGGALFGVLTGLATLTRPNGALLALGYALYAGARGERRRAAAVAMMLAMALLVAAPAARTTLAARAHGLRPGALVNYSVLHIHQASWEGFGQQIPSPLQLLRQQPAAVLQGIRRKARANARALGLFPGPLFLLPLLSLPGALRRRRDPAAAVPPLEAEAAAADGRQPTTAAELRRVWWVLAGANLAFYCASWVAAGALRYLLPTTTLLLPLLLAAGFRRAGHSSAARSMAVVLVAGTLLLLAGYWHTHCQWMQRRWQPAGWEPYHVAARWIAAVTGPDEVVASNNPWMIHALTRRPALACPYFRPGADLTALARTFSVRWVVLIVRPGEPRLRHCLQHPAAQLVRTQDRGRRAGIYLFSVAPPPSPAGRAQRRMRTTKIGGISGR